MKPLVSVIIPFYENLDWLKEAVDSVLNQSYDNYEIIIINDGSNENLKSFLQIYEKKISYFYKKNGGPATARNLGIEKAVGKYIAFLDSDDIWDSNKLEKQIELMENNNSIWSHTSYRLFGCGEDKIIDIEGYGNMIFDKILVSSPLATPCIIVRGEILRNNQDLRFNPAMRYGQDYYLWLKLASKFPIHYLDEPLCSVRIRGANAARRAKVQLRTRATIWYYLNDSSNATFNGITIKKRLKIPYMLCNHSSYIADGINKIIKNENVTEYISKVLYFLPWLMLKVNKHLMK